MTEGRGQPHKNFAESAGLAGRFPDKLREVAPTSSEEPQPLADLLPDVLDELAEVSARQRVADRHNPDDGDSE